MTPLPDSTQLRTLRAQSEHAEAIVSLFQRVGCPCYCRYWDFPEDARMWQLRCATEPHENREELLSALREAPADEGPVGVVALEPSGSCVGWMRLARPARLQKLYQGRLYRGLPCFSGSRKDTLAVSCFLVDVAWRQSGVATRLLERGIELAHELGARALEAFPRRADDVADEAHWMGPPSLFLAQGFTVVHDFGPYPVLRREIVRAGHQQK